MNYRIPLLVTTILFGRVSGAADADITPYRPPLNVSAHELPQYEIPARARRSIPRPSSDSDIIYYLSTPPTTSYPIAIFCTGSSNRNTAVSVIHPHRLMLAELADFNVAVLTIEQQGIDGSRVDRDEFMRHYTRSARLRDHCAVMNYFIANPPVGWDGTFILIGASEGCPLVLRLTERFSDRMRATIHWSGAGDCSWREQLWPFLQAAPASMPWWARALWKLQALVPSRLIPDSMRLPTTRADYDCIMDEVLANPTADRIFAGMTFQYHADALQQPAPHYDQLKTPLLIVAGTRDSIIESCDAFVEKARCAGVPVTYMRVSGMDHYVRRRPDVIAASFAWLAEQL